MCASIAANTLGGDIGRSLNRIPVACFNDALPDIIRPMRINLGLDCPIDVPRCDPRCGAFSMGRGGLLSELGLGGDGFPGFPGGGELGLPCCGGQPDFGRFDQRDILVWLEGAIITEVQDVLIYELGGNRQPQRLGIQAAHRRQVPQRRRHDGR